MINGKLGLDNIELVGPASTPGDFDGDGDVDGDDLTDPTLGWKARFGADLEGADFDLAAASWFARQRCSDGGRA